MGEGFYSEWPDPGYDDDLVCYPDFGDSEEEDSEEEEFFSEEEFEI